MKPVYESKYFRMRKNFKNHSSYIWRKNGTYNNPEHLVQTNEPIVTSTYVGPLWLQSKQYLLKDKAANSRRVFKFFSSCFLREAISAQHNTNYLPQLTTELIKSRSECRKSNEVSKNDNSLKWQALHNIKYVSHFQKMYTSDKIAKISS